ncbi:MAG TPA: hypothetical protein VGO68_09440 [Pyrinomonadaceae bacterium]|nr:hypothetical protein [Pyrinomonadaceae bacterium]
MRTFLVNYAALDWIDLPWRTVGALAEGQALSPYTMRKTCGPRTDSDLQL